MAARSDGWTFVLVPTKQDGPHIIAGCQYLTPEAYRVHTLEYHNEAKRAETLLIIDFLEKQAALEAWR